MGLGQLRGGGGTCKSCEALENLSEFLLGRHQPLEFYEVKTPFTISALCTWTCRRIYGTHWDGQLVTLTEYSRADEEAIVREQASLATLPSIPQPLVTPVESLFFEAAQALIDLQEPVAKT